MKNFVKLSFYDQLGLNLGQDLNLIQVILGPRQVGKTTTVKHFLENEYSGRYLFKSADAILTPDFNWLNETWQEARKGHDLIVIDEIQKIENWSEIIKKLWDEERGRESKLRCVLLGSSSLEIQKGLSESLTGRFQLIRAHHWSLSESKELAGFNLEKYLKFGGYPATYYFSNEPDKFVEYLQTSIISTVIDKDILSNHKVKSPALFRQAFELINSYPAQEISYTKLLGQLQDKGNTDLVKYYLSLYEGAFLVKSLFKYSSKPLKRRTSSPKLLPLCPSFYYLTIQDDYSEDERGRAFELAVGTALTRLPIEIFYWRDGNLEVDYVVKKGKRLVAIEVKSGRRKNEKGLKAFCERHPEARPIFITPENFNDFESKGMDFLFG